MSKIYSENKKISVVEANFKDQKEIYWQELFEGYNEIYVITFSSGLEFMEHLLAKFSYAEIIFGCDKLIRQNIEDIIIAQQANTEIFIRNDWSAKMYERLKNNNLKIHIARDTKSHEKIFIMKSDNGNTRVVVGSANMSATAFGGIQRENIVYFDDTEAFEYYYDLFKKYQDECSDELPVKTVKKIIDEPNYLSNNPTEIPIVKTIQEVEKVVVVKEEEKDTEEYDIIVANLKDINKDIKTVSPKPKKDGTLILTKNLIEAMRKTYKNIKKTKTIKKALPKLSIDYDEKSISFMDNKFDLKPKKVDIISDIICIQNYFSNLDCFFGDISQGRHEYFLFINWYLASPFMPYLRYLAYKNNYPVMMFPVTGIIYGDSNGGKSTFLKLLSKMMCGVNVPFNNSNSFTYSQINALKLNCEGLPLNIDDLSKDKYNAHAEKIIKDDEWGLIDYQINYPALAITTNKIPSISNDISKRTVLSHVTIKIDKEAGMKNAKKINDSLSNISTAFYREYFKRMIDIVLDMKKQMQSENTDYYPDIFKESSKVLINMFIEYTGELPSYVKQLSSSDYFGNGAVSKSAVKKIKKAWQTEPEQFSINKRKNQLIYSYPANGRLYELKQIESELPPMLGASATATKLVMNLDAAEKFFKIKFKKNFIQKIKEFKIS